MSARTISNVQRLKDQYGGSNAVDVDCRQGARARARV